MNPNQERDLLSRNICPNCNGKITKTFINPGQPHCSACSSWYQFLDNGWILRHEDANAQYQKTYDELMEDREAEIACLKDPEPKEIVPIEYHSKKVIEQWVLDSFKKVNETFDKMFYNHVIKPLPKPKTGQTYTWRRYDSFPKNTELLIEGEEPK